MPVAKQTYTVTSPYTATGLAAVFRQAFIDAGLMTEWFDAFQNNSIENRILEVVYDAAKAYGKIYYWFMFSGADVFVHICSGWNSSTDSPSGSQYLDFVSSSTNTTANHMRFMAMNNLVTTTISRYSSADSPGFSWFVIRNGTNFFNMHVSKVPPSSWAVDMAKVVYPALMWCEIENTTLRFKRFPPVLRRDFLGTGLRGDTASSSYGGGTNGTPWNDGAAAGSLRGYSYAFPGNSTGSSNNYAGMAASAIAMPIGFNNVNPAYTADDRPIFSSVPLTPYSGALLPTDFAISGIYTATNLDLFSLVVVSPTEEYDVLAVRNGTSYAGQPTIAFLARTK